MASSWPRPGLALVSLLSRYDLAMTPARPRPGLTLVPLWPRPGLALVPLWPRYDPALVSSWPRPGLAAGLFCGSGPSTGSGLVVSLSLAYSPHPRPQRLPGPLIGSQPRYGLVTGSGPRHRLWASLALSPTYSPRPRPQLTAPSTAPSTALATARVLAVALFRGLAWLWTGLWAWLGCWVRGGVVSALAGRTGLCRGLSGWWSRPVGVVGWCFVFVQVRACFSFPTNFCRSIELAGQTMFLPFYTR